MTGLIFDIKKYAIHDGPGIRTTVFFKGCPLECNWCHNPESRKAEPETFQLTENHNERQVGSSRKTETVGRTITVDQLMIEILKDQPFYEQSGGGVTFSGGEPMMQADFLKSVLLRCREESLHTAVDSSGYADFTEFEKLKGLVDLWLYDLKLFDDIAHTEQVGVSNCLIHDNLKALHDSGENINVRLPLIPDITDTENNLAAIAEFISPMRGIRDISLMPYNKIGEDKTDRFGLDRASKPMAVQSDTELRQKASIFESLGRAVRIGG